MYVCLAAGHAPSLPYILLLALEWLTPSDERHSALRPASNSTFAPLHATPPPMNAIPSPMATETLFKWTLNPFRAHG